MTLIVEPGEPAHLAKRNPADRLGLASKDDGHEHAEPLLARLDELHNRLWAEARRSVLLVLQGMDASGKDGTIRRVLTGLNPQGCDVVNFKEPTDARPRARLPLARPRAVPAAGDPRRDEPIALRGRRHRAPDRRRRRRAVRRKRYRHIREFERMLHDEGTTVVKVFLHISKDEQRAAAPGAHRRPDEELEVPPVRPRGARALGRVPAAATRRRSSATSTEWAPWYVVPGDHKWVRDVAVATLLVDVFERLDPGSPTPKRDLRGIVVE